MACCPGESFISNLAVLVFLNFQLLFLDWPVLTRLRTLTANTTLFLTAGNIPFNPFVNFAYRLNKTLGDNKYAAQSLKYLNMNNTMFSVLKLHARSHFTFYDNTEAMHAYDTEHDHHGHHGDGEEEEAGISVIEEHVSLLFFLR